MNFDLIKHSSKQKVITWQQAEDDFALQKLSLSSLYMQIKNIFFISSSRQIFDSELEKNNFFWRWTDYYFNYQKDYIYLHMADQILLGYLMGCPNSFESMDYFSKNIPSQVVFANLFHDYPAHLHINVLAEARGHNVGSHLIDRYIKDLVKMRSRGVHLVTSPDSRNVNFYRKNRFLFSESRKYKAHELFFMGRSLL